MTYMFLAVSVISVLHLWPVAASAFPHDHVCTVEHDFDSPYVHPYFEKTAFVVGCESKENTSDAKEVHVISLIGGGPDEVTMDENDENGNRPEVVLHIKPRPGIGTHTVPMIFILVSHSRVAWKIQSDRISNQTRHLFVLSEKSRMFRDDMMRIKVRKVNIPVEQQELARWVREKYHAITSFAVVKTANTFHKTVGIDSSASAVCDTTDEEFMPLRRGSITAYHLQRQPVNGCVFPEEVDRKNSDVHIIELHSANIIANPTVDTVMLDIRTKRRVRHKNLLLILKAHDPVEWRVRTKHIRGSLDILTNNVVNTVGVELQIIQVTAEDLSKSGQNLINWVTEKYGGLFVSYSSIQYANKIDIFVDGAEYADGGGKEPPQDDEPNRGGRRILPFDDPKRTQRALSQAIKSQGVTCHQNGMMVTLKKSKLQAYGIRREHLSLADESCTAMSNTTHIHLETSLSSCQTAKQESNDRVVFSNAIIVHNIEESDMTDDDEGSAYWNDDDIIASGFFMDDTHIDDEDYEPSIHNGIIVHFRCEYPPHAFIEPTNPPRDFYQLELYKDPGYQEKFSSFPLTLDVASDVFVEARVVGDEKLRAVIQNCWVTSSLTDESDRQNLIVRGCLVGESVGRDSTEQAVQGRTSTRNTAWTQSQRFKFVFHQYYDPGTQVYLQCELTMCSRDGIYGAPPVKRCMPLREYCMWNQVKANKQKRLLHTMTRTLGPIVPRSDELEIAHQGPTDSQTGDDQKCEQVVHVEGLDSGTVVGIAFAAFIIGVLLTAALWFIHTHTNGRKTTRQRSNETSGESTPSSTAPITIHQIHT